MPILTPNERVGTEIGGRYRLTRIIGEGAFGAVFEAEHTMTSREVAIKILHPHLVSTEQISQRFLREAQAMAKLRHPGITEVLDAGREPDGTIFLALELLQGETLEATLTRSGRLTRHEAVQLAIELLDALAAAHAHDIIHRDIKPANIFLARAADGTTHAKLLDFGIALVAPKGGGKLTSTGTILGTPEYMSPEQGRGAAVGPAADLWSVGIVLYEMLSGVVPWTSENATAVLMAVANDPPADIREFAPDLPGSIVEVIYRALAKNPEDRFPSAADMRHALAAAMRDAGDDPGGYFAAMARAASRIGGMAPAARARVGSNDALPAARGVGGAREIDLDETAVATRDPELAAAVADLPLPEPPSMLRDAQSFLGDVPLPPPPSDPHLPSAGGPRHAPSQARPSVPPPGAARPITGPVRAQTASPAAAARSPGANASQQVPQQTHVLPPRTRAPSEGALPAYAASSAAAPAGGGTNSFPKPSVSGAAAPRNDAPRRVAPSRGKSRVGAAVAVPVALVAVAAVAMLAIRLRGETSAQGAGHGATDDPSRGDGEGAADAGAGAAGRARRELTERMAVPVPFGAVGDDARAFARHVVVGPAREGAATRTLGTCARGTVYLYAGGDGVGASAPAPVACERYDLAVVPDVDGDGRDDVAAVNRARDAVALLGADPPMRPIRSVPVPNAQGLVGGLVVAGQPCIVVYAETGGPGGATELVAIGLRAGQTVWRAAGRAPFERLGHPSDLGLAVGPDATGDGVPDVVAGATALASRAGTAAGGRERCVELLDGATGARAWREPFCQLRGGSQSVALVPDVDGDGRADVAIGTDVSRGADPRVVLVSGADARVIRRVMAPAGPAAAGFGWPVATGGDLDGDGAPELVIGSVGATGSFVTVVSARDGAVVAQREVPGRASAPDLRLAAGAGLVRGGAPAVLVASAAQGIRVYVLEDAAR